MKHKATIKTKRSFYKGRLKGLVKIYFIGVKGGVHVLQKDYDKLLRKLGVDSLRGKEVELIVMCDRCCEHYLCPYLMIVDGESIDIISRSYCPWYMPTTGDTNG